MLNLGRIMKETTSVFITPLFLLWLSAFPSSSPQCLLVIMFLAGQYPSVLARVCKLVSGGLNHTYEQCFVC